MKKLRAFRVFISSPGDLEKERNLIAEICNQVSQDVGQRINAILEPVRWETHAVSGMGARSQEVITRSIGDYDIYLGLMGFYFGSSTGTFSSGTEEEFNDAIEHSNSHGGPIIQFYFSAAKIDPRKIDMAQFSRVEDFRRKVGNDHGIFYKTFEDLNELSSHVRSGLTDALFKLAETYENSEKHAPGAPQENHTPSYKSLAPYEILKNLNAELRKDPNLASHYLLRQSATHFSSMANRFNAINRRLAKATNTLERATHEISKYTSGKTKSEARAQKWVKEIVDGVEELTYRLVDEIPEFSNDFSTGLEAFQRAAIIMKTSSDFSDRELEELDAEKELTADRIEEFCDVVIKTSDCLPEVEILGPRWAASRKIFRATMLDFAELLTASNNVLRKSSELYRRSQA